MWVNSVLDYYDHTADLVGFKGLISHIEQRLDHALVVDGNSAISLRWSRDDDRMGFGFESPDRPEARRAFRMLLIEASSRYSVIIESCGNRTAAKKYADMASELTSKAKSSGSDWLKEYGLHAAADAVNAGIVSKAEAATLLAPGGAFADPLQLPSLSLFESYFILKALGKMKASTEAMYLIHRGWSSMVAYGATTTWERFDPQWMDAGLLPADTFYPPVNAMNQDTSMAHPWASGATWALSKLGLGVRPVTPGFAQWEAVPLLLGPGAGIRGLNAVKGIVPTPHGSIEFNYQATPLAERNASSANAAATGSLIVTVPSGTVAARVGLPAFGRGLQDVRLVGGASEHYILGLVYQNMSRPSGQANDLLRSGVPFTVNNSTNDGDVALYLTGLHAGRYEFAFSFCHDDVLGSMSANVNYATDDAISTWDPSNANFTYDAEYRGTDKTTSGAWKTKYGNAGYVLFNYTLTGGGPDVASSSVDAVKLPVFITNVYASDPPLTGGPPFPKGRDGRHIAPVHWATNTSDTRALENPGPSSVSVPAAADRTAAAITSQGWASFHIDVEATASAPTYNVTLYMVDYNNDFVRLGIKVRDGKTLKTIALYR